MPRVSRGERSKRAKLLKSVKDDANHENGSNSKDNTSSAAAKLAAQDIASRHKPKTDTVVGAGKGRPPAAIQMSPGRHNSSTTVTVGGGGVDSGKKRPRSESFDAGQKGVVSDAPVVVDELVATIEKHDRFFSTMLDMIPENLVLPAKEVPVASYASKYMKVRFVEGHDTGGASRTC